MRVRRIQVQQSHICVGCATEEPKRLFIEGAMEKDDGGGSGKA